MARPELKKTKQSSPTTKRGDRIKKQCSKRVTRSTTAAKLQELAKRTEHNRISPLLRLPPEIRNMICEYALSGPIIEPFDSGYHDSERCGKGGWNRFTALTRVCRQIHYETRSLPFRLNTFSFDSDSELGDWLSYLDSDQKNALQTVYLQSFNCIEGSENLKILLRECSCLKTIIVDWSVLLFSEDLKLMEAEGFQKTKGYDIESDDDEDWREDCRWYERRTV